MVLLLLFKDRVLALEKNCWLGVLTAGDGEAGPRFMESKLVGIIGPVVTDRINSGGRGRSVDVPFMGGRGAGPGFMN